MKKRVYKVLLFISLLTLPRVLGAGITDTLGSVWQKILNAGNLSVLGLGSEAMIVNFSRLLLAITMFAIFFGITTTFGGKEGPFRFLNKNQAMMVSGLLAILAAIFLPVQVILAIGGAWSTAVAALLIGGPVAGLAFLLWNIPGKDQEETRGTVFLKLFLCITLFWILTVMRHHIAGGLTL